MQSTSALTWFEFNKKPNIPMEMKMFEDVECLSNFQKKCIIKDYNKEVLESYKKQADFFIMDLTDFASANIAEHIDKKNNENHFCSYTKWFRTAYTNGINKYLPEKMIIHNAVELLENDKLMKKTIDNIAHWLLEEKGYREEQIILVKNKKVNAYSDNNILVYFDKQFKRKSINDTLDRAYKYFSEKMPKCHVINMPLGTYADKYHKWGVTDLHFCKEFYDYLYTCFDLIAAGKENEIQNIFYKYSKLLTQNKEKYMLNSIYSIQKENLVLNNFDDLTDDYIVEKGASFYSKINGEYIKKGTCNRAFGIMNWEFPFAQIQHKTGEKELFVAPDECKKGYIGHENEIGKTSWKLQNQSTLVEITDKGVVVGHNGSGSKAQMQIISTIKDNEKLKGNVVTLSVWARVLEKNDTGKGGCISFINANDYNAGKFCVKEEFTNSDWKRIAVSYWVPEGEEFKGLTVCLRALASEKDGITHAKVEFSMPVVEVGSFAV